ncbi:hypothetical protein [Ralstonia sp. UBA689]|uniref:hypothetical protein n=1 Tax=Ralstonia sp. UBA689 TaxID=1947373 RepID=UPI0025E5F90D|nr:hypothetical protein [Ralstonia sp. UBA689]
MWTDAKFDALNFEVGVKRTASTDRADHYFVGLTLQSSAGGLARIRGCDGTTLPASLVYPPCRHLSDFVKPIMRQIHDDGHARQVLMRPVLGQYGTSRELSVGLEIEAAPGFNATALAASVFLQARAARQTDAFVGRVLQPDEWTDNARPGLTVLLRTPKRISAITQLVRQIVEFPGDGWTIDGFTTIPAADGRIGVIQGLRYLFLPEISIRWDAQLRQKLSSNDTEVELMLLDQATRLGRLCTALQNSPDIAAARLNWFDVIVAGKEDYEHLIGQLKARSQIPAVSRQSMTHKAFSETLGLTSSIVLRDRLRMIDSGETSRRANTDGASRNICVA